MIPHILYSVKRFLPIFQFFSKNFFLPKTGKIRSFIFYIIYANSYMQALYTSAKSLLFILNGDIICKL